MDDIFLAPEVSRAEILGGGTFPVRRIFCVGKNYADHVIEMGGDAKKDPPVFFTKPADAVVSSGAELPFPTMTDNLHFEGELVVALSSGGHGIALGAAENCIFGYGTGCDLTRRDLQSQAKNAGNPWDVAKAFDNSAPLGSIIEKQKADLANSNLQTFVNGTCRQDAPLSSMIWSVPEIISSLSNFFELKAGDLIFTGTPAGVGQLVSGDRVEVKIDSLPDLEFLIG